MEMTEKRTGPMVGGTAVYIGRVTCEAGEVFVAVLQHGGAVPGPICAERIGGAWVHRPGTLDTSPIVTFSDMEGGRRDTYSAAAIVENARSRVGMWITDPFGGSDHIKFSAIEISTLADSIEKAISPDAGGFEVRWVPNEFSVF